MGTQIVARIGQVTTQSDPDAPDDGYRWDHQIGDP